MRQGRPLSSVDLQPFAQRTQRLRLHRRALSPTHVPIHGMPRLQLLSVRGVSREHIRMAFSLWLLPRQGIAEHYFFGVFILLRATISEEDSPRVAIAVIPEQCAKRRPPFSSSWQIGREIQCSCLDKRDVRNLVNNGTDFSVIAYLNSEVSRLPKSCRFK